MWKYLFHFFLPLFNVYHRGEITLYVCSSARKIFPLCPDSRSSASNILTLMAVIIVYCILYSISNHFSEFRTKFRFLVVTVIFYRITPFIFYISMKTTSSFLFYPSNHYISYTVFTLRGRNSLLHLEFREITQNLKGIFAS